MSSPNSYRSGRPYDRRAKLVGVRMDHHLRGAVAAGSEPDATGPRVRRQRSGRGPDADAGEARARAQGRMAVPYDIRIRVRPFTDEEWDRVLDVISAHVGRAAALLDGELPPEIAQDVASTGLDLVPGSRRSGRGARAPTTPNPASTRRARASWSPTPSTRTPSCCSCCAAGPATKSWRDSGPGAARRTPAPAGERPEAMRDTGVDAREVFGARPRRGPIPTPPLPPAHTGHPSAIRWTRPRRTRGCARPWWAWPPTRPSAHGTRDRREPRRRPRP